MKPQPAGSLLLLILLLPLLACRMASDLLEPRPHVLLAPTLDNGSKADVELARTVLQSRLEMVLDGQANVRTSGSELRVQVRRNDQIPVVTDLASVPGLAVFFASSKYIEVGSPIPEGAHIILTEFDLDSAKPAYNRITGIYDSVAFQLTPGGTRKMAAYTESAVGEYLVFGFDGVVVTSPRVSAPILDGSGLLGGGFTEAGAKRLAAILDSGSLPYALKVVEP